MEVGRAWLVGVELGAHEQVDEDDVGGVDESDVLPALQQQRPVDAAQPRRRVARVERAAVAPAPPAQVLAEARQQLGRRRLHDRLARRRLHALRGRADADRVDRRRVRGRRRGWGRLDRQAVAARRRADVARLETVARDGLLNAVLVAERRRRGRGAELSVVVLDVRQSVDVEPQPAQSPRQPRERALLLRRRRRRRAGSRAGRAAAAAAARRASPVGDRRTEDGVRSREALALGWRPVVIDAVGAVGRAARLSDVVVVDVVDVVGDNTMLLLLLTRRAVVQLLVPEQPRQLYCHHAVRIPSRVIVSYHYIQDNSCSIGHGLHTFTVLPLGQLSRAAPGSLNRVYTSFGWSKGGNVTSAGWQVTLCDRTWHVSSRMCGSVHCELLYP